MLHVGMPDPRERLNFKKIVVRREKSSGGTGGKRVAEASAVEAGAVARGAWSRYTLDLLTRSGLTLVLPLHRWSFICNFVLLMRFSYWILLIIGIWLAVWYTWLSHVVTFLMMFTFSSQFVVVPTSVRYAHFLRVMRYLCGTAFRGLFHLRQSTL